VALIVFGPETPDLDDREMVGFNVNRRQAEQLGRQLFELAAPMTELP
jgi:hypothetical protein